MRWSIEKRKPLHRFRTLCPATELKERQLGHFSDQRSATIDRIRLTKDMIAAPSIVTPRANATFLFDALRMISLNLKVEIPGKCKLNVLKFAYL